MAAVAFPMTDPWVAPRPAPGVRTYRRRRALVLLAMATVAIVAVAALRLALAGPGGGALTTSGSSGVVGRPAQGHVYVVQPGDSLWSIVVATGRGGDPRPLVDRLALQLGGRPLQPGQRLLLP